jgi:hypothetical protein
MQQVIDQLEKLSREITSLPEEDRVLFYQRVNPFIRELKGELRRSPNTFAQTKVEELEWHLTVIAHLDDPDGQTDHEHLLEALALLDQLRSPRGFSSVSSP